MAEPTTTTTPVEDNTTVEPTTTLTLGNVPRSRYPNRATGLVNLPGGNRNTELCACKAGVRVPRRRNDARGSQGIGI